MLLLHILLLIIKLFGVISVRFENITNEIFPIDSGVIAAFGHFNSDEFTDIFTLQQGCRNLQILMGSENGQPFQSHVNCSLDSVITSVVPGDFNGDSLIDILVVTLTEQDSTEHDVRILWGGDGFVDCKASTLFKIVNQPLIVDFNGDMIPDIIGEVKSADKLERYVWISSTDKSFSNRSLQSMVNQTIRNPHSSGLFDLNNDLVADIYVTGEDYIELWVNTGKEFLQNGSIPYPPNGAKYFQSTIVDLNLDGKLDHILPVCYNNNCSDAAILAWNPTKSKWEVLLDNFIHENITWSFKLPKGTKPEITAYLPVTLRAGDIDMDGYVDFLILLQSKSKSKPIIIKNVPCTNCSQCTFDRCLEIIWDVPGLENIPNAEVIAFFDIYEDGILDIVVTTKEEVHGYKIHALKNAEILDSCFMKILVLSGLCGNCTLGHMPYGVNLPGPIVRYNMTQSDGQPLVSSAVQLSQTAYFALHLPYSVFGLGETPNFIDALTVSVPEKFDKSAHKREWTQIIPNSQIVVIPHPPNDERRWVKKLFVTPSHYVFLTCIALIGTCTFVAFIVAVLHWRERKEDKKEKMQDAYRFHFDAM